MIGLAWRAIPFLWRLGIVAGLAAALISSATAGYLFWRHKQRMIGYQRALAEISDQNERASKVAAGVLSDIDQCERAGGSWNVSTGNCDR